MSDDLVPVTTDEEPPPPGTRPQELYQELQQSRRLAVGVSITCGAVGFLPVPLLPDLAATALRSAMLHRMARRRDVELAYEAARVITGEEGGTMAQRFASSLLSLRNPLMLSLRVVMRFEDMARTFLQATYADYYLLTLHEGEQVTQGQAVLLREAVQRASSRAHLDVLSALFQRAVSDAVRLGLVVPRRMWNLCMTLIHKGEEALEEEEEVSGQHFISSVAKMVDRELDLTKRETLDALLDGFDHAWGEVTAGTT